MGGGTGRVIGLLATGALALAPGAAMASDPPPDPRLPPPATIEAGGTTAPLPLGGLGLEVTGCWTRGELGVGGDPAETICGTSGSWIIDPIALDAPPIPRLS